MGITELNATLAKYVAARDAILTSQSYSINGRSVTRADLSAIEKQIGILESRIGRLTRGTASVKSPSLGA
jgi:hypothetical protein